MQPHQPASSTVWQPRLFRFGAPGGREAARREPVIASTGCGAITLNQGTIKMRKLFLTLVPAIAIAALPALAQSSVSSSESTTTSTTGIVPAPVETQTTKKVVRSEDSNSPMADSHSSRSYERQTTSNGFNSSTQTKSSEHSVSNGVDGSSSESRTTTTQTGQQ